MLNIRTKSALIVTLLLSTFSSLATTILQKPGCYLVTGIVEKITEERLVLKIYPETRSQAVIVASIIFEDPKFEKKLIKAIAPQIPLEVEVMVPESGDPVKQKLTAKISSFRTPPSTENLITKVWRACR